jgi:hypothetical protein
MTKKPKRPKQKKKKAKAKKARASRRRRTRVKPIVGPFQIELPLQMPLFPHEPSSAPARPEGTPPASAPVVDPAPAPSQPLLVTPGLAS